MNWTYEKKTVKEIYENPKNPRRLSKKQSDQLHTSIKKFGLCEPIVINQDGTVVGGHQRLRTLRKLGYKEVDVIIPDIPLTEEEVDELTIRLNKNTGDWDFDVLANIWDPESLLEWGFALEELHLEALPEGEGSEEEQKPQQKCTMTITFTSADHLQEAENSISTIVDEYAGAFYKVRIK